jgi:hypothetical protein
MEQNYTTGLIHSRLSALIGLGLTALVAQNSVRALFSKAPIKSDWLPFPSHFSPLPAWFLIFINVLFYAFLVWLGTRFYLFAKGKECIVVLGWLNVLLLTPVQHFVSPAGATAIQWVKAVGMTAALLAAAFIFLAKQSCTRS